MFSQMKLKVKLCLLQIFIYEYSDFEDSQKLELKNIENLDLVINTKKFIFICVTDN